MESKETKKQRNKATSLTTHFTELKEIRESQKHNLGWIRDNLAPSLNEEEILLFLLRAQNLGLNPLNGEIFAYASGSDGARKMTMIIARDGKRKLAAKTGELNSIEVFAIYTGKEGKAVNPWEGGVLWGASCTVHRSDRRPTFVTDAEGKVHDDVGERVFKVVVPLSEYKGNSPIWRSKPETMIKKVAESQCLSMAFPELLSGVYDESERFDNNGDAPELEDGGKPATDAQLKTVASLGGNTRPMTKQEAADEIRELAKKGKKK